MSWQMHAAAAFLRITAKPGFASERGGRAMLDRAKPSGAPPRRVTRRRAVRSARIGGFDVHTVPPRSGAPRAGAAIVYLHGGAYANQIVRQHWGLIAELADEVGAEVLVPIYGLAPQHDAAEAHAFVAAVLDRLRAEGRLAYLVGDSAGGGLALAAVQEAQRTNPGRIVGATLLSPWLDLGMSNPGIAAIEPHDPWLSRTALRVIARAWAGDWALDDPRVSPIFGALGGLPPLQVFAGTRDLTVADCRVLRDRLAGAPGFEYVEEEGALHVYPLVPAPERTPARRAIAARIRSVLPKP